MSGTRQKAKEILSGRKLAYCDVFKESEAQKLVLSDLEKFCRAKESCFHPDPRLHAALEGRREVFLRIKDFLDLTVTQLEEKYAQPIRSVQGETNVRST